MTYRDLTTRRTGVIPHLNVMTTHLGGNIPQNLCELFEGNLGLSHKIFGFCIFMSIIKYN